jgi:2-amino-4-hydroxy-6-hydroxymethyldihydropteridine diphosphokinase
VYRKKDLQKNMTDCLIAFGGNLSNPKLTFQLALKDLCSNGFELSRKSGLWSSPAWPEGSEQPDYLNAVVKGRYRGEAAALLRLLQTTETNHGRVRSVRNAARTLDLDLLVFGEVECETENLTLPHPRMTSRAFVLLPAVELEVTWLQYLKRFSNEKIRGTRYVGSW